MMAKNLFSSVIREILRVMDLLSIDKVSKNGKFAWAWL